MRGIQDTPKLIKTMDFDAYAPAAFPLLVAAVVALISSCAYYVWLRTTAQRRRSSMKRTDSTPDRPSLVSENGGEDVKEESKMEEVPPPAPISPDELDALEVEKLARMASRKRNRQRLFAVSQAIREACHLPGVTPVDREDARLMAQFDKQTRALHASSLSTTTTDMRPKLIPDTSTTAAPGAASQAKNTTVVLPLQTYEVVSFGNVAVPTITARQKPGEERPAKMGGGPVKIAVPLPCPAGEVTCSFTVRGFDLLVRDRDGGATRRRLKLGNLERDINPQTSSWTLRDTKVILLLEKADPMLTWYSIQGDLHRKTHEALKVAEKQREKDPMAAMAHLVDEFCSALPNPGSRDAEEAYARTLHQRVMMGFDAALEQTHREVERLEEAKNVNVA
eukprot:GEMP01033795.1.p1 GENE.GEMP01033795.1~~GEMP01033795.1.p1  ORF type:complete len:393 (+),score=140.60 GEMP01033795.1:217-1395(+)